MPVHIPAGDLPPALPMIISSSPTHLVIAFEISRTELARHERFLRLLLQAARPASRSVATEDE
jgi:hypothetical protein